MKNLLELAKVLNLLASNLLASIVITNVANRSGLGHFLGLAQNTTVLYDESAESSSQEDGYAHGRDYHPLVLYGRR